MLKEKAIEILMADGCTKKGAENYLKNGASIYEDLEERLDFYLNEWGTLCDDNFLEGIRKMVETKKPFTDWGVVEMDGKTYYIEYVL